MKKTQIFLDDDNQYSITVHFDGRHIWIESDPNQELPDNLIQHIHFEVGAR